MNEEKKKNVADLSTAKLGLLLNEINSRMALLNQDRISLLTELEKRDSGENDARNNKLPDGD